jgi:signal transduction histidine kinase/ActR/RegA family two-component response regulator
MRLSKRLAIFLFASAFTAVIIGMVAFYFMIMPRFFAYEEEVVRGDVETVENALVQMLTGLHVRARDWSSRTDLRAWIEETSGAEKPRLPNKRMGALRVDQAGVIRRDGDAKWLRGGVEAQPLERLHQRFRARDCYSFWGVTRLSEGPAIFAMEPVGSGCDALLFAVSLDERVASELEGITGLPVDLVRVDDQDDEDARHIQVERTRQGHARGSFPLESYDGDVLLRARVKVSHPLYGEGLETMFWTALLFLVVALAIAGVVWWVLRRLVFARLDRLHGTVRALANGPDLSRHVALGGRDELSELAEDFNQMVDNIRAARDELARERENAESANRAKSLFLANMSHEIRTPMTAVLGYTDLMQREADLAPHHRRYLDIIQENGDVLLALMNDVLDLSRIEAGEVQVEHRCFDLPRLLSEVMATHALRAREKELTLELAYTTRVPDQVITDPLRLRQILINLVGNAVKFTDAGRVDVDIGWEAGVQPFLHIRVRDTGVGIAAETLEAIFKPFAQEDASHTRRFGGSGLGLAIARELARSLGGDVSARSTPDEGSEFHLWVRAVAASESEFRWHHTEEDDYTELAATSELSGTALVVEDNAVNRLFVKQVLESAGMTVIEAEEGEAALGRIEHDGPPDLVVLDMQMPIMDGFQTVRALRERGADVPVLALTANVMDDDHNECIRAGCDAFIGKPVRVGSLLSTCARLLGLAKASGHGDVPGSTDRD